MSRRISRQTQQQILMQTWWVRALLAIASLLIAYGFISLAIDSGNLFEYGLAILALWYAVHNVIKSVRLGIFT